MQPAHSHYPKTLKKLDGEHTKISVPRVSLTRPTGIIRVSLKKGWRSGTVITVEDSGPGIREEFREAIFERLYTSRKGEAVTENASGLGLAIVKQIVDAHGGRINVRSSDLGGARFEIKF